MVQNIRNIGGFFSEYYLGQLKESSLKGRLGESTLKESYNKISKIYEKAELILDKSSLKHKLISHWINPLLNILGFEENMNLLKNFEIKTEKEDLMVDFAFFPKDYIVDFDEIIRNNESPFLLIDIYKWDTTLGQKLGSGYDNTPLKRMINKLALSKAKWGFIINGLKIWLLRKQLGFEDNSFLEVDLKAIFDESDNYSFEIFWALFRAKMFYSNEEKPCLLDFIDKESREQAVKVGEFLKESVYEAIETLMQGILDDQSNKMVLKEFELKEIFHQSLIFMYRLLFIFYAESEGLLPINNDIYRDNYSIESIRILLENFHVQFYDNKYILWESLQALFKMLDRGIDSGDIYITAYNGYLFSNKDMPILRKIRVNDKVLKKVITFISSTPAQKFRGREPISYKELGVSQLGGIYEGILEYEPKVAQEYLDIIKERGNLVVLFSESNEKKEKVINQIKKGAFYLCKTGGIRKSSGSYYTPEIITEFIVKQSLEPIIQKKTSDEILKIKVLDPAMGSGAFLVKVCEFLANIYGQKLIDEGKLEKDILTEEDFRRHKRKIVENCIYGVDLNPMAVELAKVSLWLMTAIDQSPLNFLDHKLKVGNSLIGTKLTLINDIKSDPSNKTSQKKYITLDHWFGTSFNIRSEIKRLLNYRGPEFLSSPDTDLKVIENKYKCLIKLHSKNSKLIKIKDIFNIWTSQWFIKEESLISQEQYIEIVKDVLNNRILSESQIKFLHEVEEIKNLYKIFHWELEFPEIFFNYNGELRNDSGFDVVLGNPPYVNWSDIDNYRSCFERNSYEKCKYKARPNHADAQPNLYLFFLVRAIDLVKKMGKVCYILPHEWLFHDRTQPFRKYFSNSTGDLKILKFHPDYRVFKGLEVVGTSSAIIFFDHNGGDNISIIQLKEKDDDSVKDFIGNLNINNIDENYILEAEFQSGTKISYAEKSWKIRDKLIIKIDQLIHKNKSKFISLNSKKFNVIGGFQPPIKKSKEFLLKYEKLEVLNEIEKDFIFPCIYDASRIKRYYIEIKDLYWIVLNKAFKTEKEFQSQCPHLYEILSDQIENKNSDWWEFPNVRNLRVFKNSKEKILTPRTANRNTFALDFKKHIIKGTNSCIISYELSTKYCVGVLNSRLANYWYQELGYDYHGGLTKKYEPQKIKEYMMPIAKPTRKQEEGVENILKVLIEKEGNEDDEYKKLENRLDAIIFHLYSLDKEDIWKILNKLNVEDHTIKQILKYYDELE